ncbi:hypothetical protein KAX08_00425 [candidate division WOR-3 bacterium]|nr:hypothetical protein [candidate division WOR-3 bacterium]
MKTKEEIEFLEEAIDCAKRGNIIPVLQECDKRFKRVINLLQRGEKYEAMWGEFKEKYGTIASMKDFEQKYFPDQICGTCEHYDDICFCLIHPEWGEIVEKDSCDDWREDDSIPK